MFIIGSHLSTSKGFYQMGKTALDMKANTFQFFSRNPRGGAAKKIDPEDARKLNELLAENEFGPILAHAPYTLNPASAKDHVREFARMAMEDDLERMENFPGNLYNFHPGSHVGLGVDEGIKEIVSLLNDIMTEDQSTIVLLEAMSGKGTEIGRNFEELARIIDGVELKDKIGVCIDTCHIWEGGYNIKDDLDGVLEEFDKLIGVDKIKAIHLNDSKNPMGAHKDRHEKIGQGYLGEETFKKIINHPDLKDLGFYLETPNEIEGYAEEISLLKTLRD